MTLGGDRDRALNRVSDTNRRLRGWKEIGRYLRVDDRTVRRWEQRGMPVHRLPGVGRSAVYADADRLDLRLLRQDVALAERSVSIETQKTAIAVSTQRWMRALPRKVAGLAAALALIGGSAAWVRNGSGETTGSEKVRPDQKAAALVVSADQQNARATPQAFRSAVALSQAALGHDPNYAPAYAAIAFADIRLPDAGAVDRADVYRRAQAAAQRALELDPSLWRAHSPMGFIEYGYNWNFPKASVTSGT